MALDFADNFSMYGQGNDVSAAVLRMSNGVYAEVQKVELIEDPDPNVTGTVASFTLPTINLGTAQPILRKTFLASANTMGLGCRIWMDDLPYRTTGRPSWSFRDGSNAVLVTVAVSTTGSLDVYRGDAFSGTLLGSSTGPVVTSNAWQHIEMRVFTNATTGSVEIKVEGVTVVNLTNQNTTATAMAQVSFRYDSSVNSPGNPTPFAAIKDLVIWNTSGTYNNTFMGPVVVYSLIPDADVALNWTPSTGSNGYSILDNRPPDDTQYLSAGNSPIPQEYEASLTNLPVDVTSVKAIQTVVRATKEDGGDGNLQITLRSGANTTSGANRPITASFTYWRDTFEADPTTLAPWTPGAVDAVVFEMDRTL
jgi:hypothetical protein